ncbi:MAG: hypothetical protein A2289_12550 [Deltaproteobacteria bacterium RIFOXYA12_FULL_58_15]|nr:MAG: hypothetical protein A2289_12550 [Deltaproteobacteria bacterium RIFOXYA12_FULL_58_15]
MELVCPTCNTAFAANDASLLGGEVPCPKCHGLVQSGPIPTINGPSALSGFDSAVQDLSASAPELTLDGPAPLVLDDSALDLSPADSGLNLSLDDSAFGGNLSLGGGTELSLDGIGGGAGTAGHGISLDGDGVGEGPAFSLDSGPELSLDLSLNGSDGGGLEQAGEYRSEGEGLPAGSGVLDLDDGGKIVVGAGLADDGQSLSTTTSLLASTSSTTGAVEPRSIAISRGQPSVEPVSSRHAREPSLESTHATGHAHSPGSQPSAMGARSSSSWRLGAAVGGTAVLAIGIVVAMSIIRNRPPAPPRIPNPLRHQVGAWVAQGVVADEPSVDAAMRVAREGLQSGSDQGMRNAYRAARSALIRNADSAQAIAAYGLVLSQWPDRIDEESINTALGAITSAIGDDPDSVYRTDLERARAWLLVRAGRAEAARQAAERALQLKPESSSLRLVSAVSRMRTRPDVAAEEMVALKDEPDAPPDLAAWTGEAYLRSGNVKRALGVWQGALGRGPEDVGVLRRLTRFAVALGDFRGATSQLRHILDRGWASVDDRLLLARLLLREGNAEEAFDIVNAGLRDEDLSPLNRARLIGEKVVIVTSGRGLDSSGVSKWLDEALALSPDLPELLYVAGQVDESAGAVDNAIDSLEAAFNLAPDQPHVAMLLAMLLQLQEPREASQVVATALKESPHHVPLHLMAAFLELEKGDLRAAAAAVRRAIDFDPARAAEDYLEPYAAPVQVYLTMAKQFAKVGRQDNPVLDTAAAAAYYFAQDLGKANAAVNRAVRSDPNEVGARLYRAVFALEAGKSAPAKRDLAAALDSDSRHRVVRLYQARVLEESSKSQSEAERIYRDLLDANPLDGASRVGLARTLAARGAMAEAQAAAVAVLLGRPNDRAALSFLTGESPQEKAKGKTKGKGKGKGKRHR